MTLASPEVEARPKLSSARGCECWHDFTPLEHYLSLPVARPKSAQAGANSYDNSAGATPCHMRAAWVATIAGEAPEGVIPPTTHLLCVWCKTHWAAHEPGYYEELL